MIKKYLAEFLGAFLIVLIGCGAIVMDQSYYGIVTHLGISISFGVIVSVAIYLFRNYSTHFNPAVSITLYAHKQLSLKHLLFYLFFQCFGAIVAALLLRLIFPVNSLLGSTMPSGSLWQSFALEFGLTFLLLSIIFILETYTTKYAGIIIGFLIFLEAYFAGPICGASMNPSRSIGPALISGHTEHLWIYILAPIAGGLTTLLFFNRKKS